MNDKKNQTTESVTDAGFEEPWQNILLGYLCEKVSK